MLFDTELRNQYHELQEVIAGLNEVLLEPSDEVIAKVMEQLRSKVAGK
ncbi:MAG: hypothetical protein N2044_07160 [Cyclobacteriaceae bacterium]|nr:hypothetical protein [Cyclobacteriaceae bacterium]MCX7637604.1 hypothetical protein [Cyclobacteriaceae bacterium]MDW8330731.1 hypothetical protein [Cyclobacteriaceae bacterium]